MSITTEQYTALDRAYDYFNQKLWGGTLPACLITLQRRHTAYGYFWAEQFKNLDGKFTDEIAMNPEHLHRDPAEALSTLVHEMAHLWQQHYGKPSRTGYHNREWAAEMERIGLIPSNTGQPGGKRTGQRMTHYIKEDGLFAMHCESLLRSGFKLDWGALGAPSKERPKSKVKYSCMTCEQNAWAKPGAVLVCGHCMVEMLMEEDDSEN